MDPAEPQTVTATVNSVGTSNVQTEPTTEPTTTEPMHTDAEAALLKQVQTLTAEVAKLRDENKKLFLRIGGDDGQTAKTPDDEIRTMLKGFRESGYNPNKLYGGV